MDIMEILLIELNPSEIAISRSLPINEQSATFIYEHLRYYCSKFFPLPAIKVRARRNSLIVIKGHEYLLIAKELRHTSIRAIVDVTSDNIAIQQLLTRPSVKKLHWNTMREDDHELFSYGWHVFFFQRDLEEKEQAIFKEKLSHVIADARLLQQFIQPHEIKDFAYIPSLKCIECQVYTPVADERWFNAYRATLLEFHTNFARIVSFQGRKFSESLG